MASKRTKDGPTGLGLDGLRDAPGLPIAPRRERSPVRAVANVLDSALLVLVALVALVIVWWLVSSVISTVLFFVKLAALAVVLAVLVRAWLWVRRRRG